MCKGFRKQRVILLVACTLLLFSASLLSAASTICKVTATKASIEGKTVKYTLTGATAPPYSVTERFAPFRVVMDIAGAEFSEKPQLMPKNGFVKMKIEALKGDAAPGKRFIFTLADSHDYDVNQSGNTVVISFVPAKRIETAESAAADVPQPAGSSPSVPSIHDFQIAAMPGRTTVLVRADKQIEDYSVDKIVTPGEIPRMFIDIAGVNIDGLPREKRVNSELVSKVRVTPKGDGVRILFDSATADLFQYRVTPSSSGLEVIIRDSDDPVSAQPVQKEVGVASTQAAPVPKVSLHPIKPVNTPSVPAPSSSKPVKKDSTLDKLIHSSEELAAKDPEVILAETPTRKLTEADEFFSLSGYEKQRITVDFYKIDIHNVFRLFREITDLNIIVDEKVAGSLTLALNDVPWDFALDIILNLMDLKKKERFNTIVIYPAGKEFVWPSRVEENLSFKPDMDIVREQDALLVEKTESQPAEIMQARELLKQAQLLEKERNFEDAALLYDKALGLWPGNKKIAHRLASLYLVELRMNAKALFYADYGLKQDPDDRSAALYAAIASANMQRLSQANEYFIRSISDTPPKKEALMNYAAFCENNGMNEAALKLLAKYKKYYGEEFNSMIAVARILDKTGEKSQAKSQYMAILSSGYQLPPDLRRYIQQRVTVGAE